MSFQTKWIETRSKQKIEKAMVLKQLLNKVDKVEDYSKLKELIDIYLDAHDFTSRVGVEIAKFSDKYTSK